MVLLLVFQVLLVSSEIVCASSELGADGSLVLGYAGWDQVKLGPGNDHKIVDTAQLTCCASCIPSYRAAAGQ